MLNEEDDDGELYDPNERFDADLDDDDLDDEDDDEEDDDDDLDEADVSPRNAFDFDD